MTHDVDVISTNEGEIMYQSIFSSRVHVSGDLSTSARKADDREDVRRQEKQMNEGMDKQENGGTKEQRNKGGTKNGTTKGCWKKSTKEQRIMRDEERTHG